MYPSKMLLQYTRVRMGTPPTPRAPWSSLANKQETRSIGPAGACSRAPKEPQSDSSSTQGEHYCRAFPFLHLKCNVILRCLVFTLQMQCKITMLWFYMADAMQKPNTLIYILHSVDICQEIIEGLILILALTNRLVTRLQKMIILKMLSQFTSPLETQINSVITEGTLLTSLKKKQEKRPLAQAGISSYLKCLSGISDSSQSVLAR